MGLFHNIIERKSDGSSTIVNYDIILSEYARTKDLVNYLHKGRNNTNILHSNTDMGNNKITNLGNPGSPNDAVSKRFLYKQIQKLTTDYNLESVSDNINSIKNKIAELQQSLLSNRKSIQEKSMSLQNEIAKMSEALSLDVSTTENEIMKKLRKDIRVGVSSIKDNLAKLNDELIDNNELQEKLDGLTNQFHVMYDDFKQKMNEIKHETEEGIANMQTALETTVNEVKTNTAERIRIAESISSVKRDLDIISEQLASNIEGRSLAAELRAAKKRLEAVNSDLVSLIAGNENEIVKWQRVVGGEAPMTTNLDMGGYRILDVAHPRDPSKKKDLESDLVTAKTLYDYMARVDQNYMRRERDGSLDGRLNMSTHRISGLSDPTDADDAVTRRYVASRFQALSDEVQDNKSKLGALQNLLGVVNNQVLIREYELIEGDFEHISGLRHDERGRIIEAMFMKYPREPDEINDFEFLDIFTLKENLIHLFEEPVDNHTWLRIKQPGTYTMHFNLISFYFHLSYTQEAR